MPAHKSTPESFWSHVDRRNNNECWEWQGSIGKAGYGVFGMNHKQHSAHRLAYQFTHGTIPGKLLVCHQCDNKLCCNPNHLFLGTHQDNTLDMIHKGRNNPRKGEHNHNHKISESDVLEIRELSKTNLTQEQIASKFGIARTMISRIIHRKRWKHL